MANPLFAVWFWSFFNVNCVCIKAFLWFWELYLYILCWKRNATMIKTLCGGFSLCFSVPAMNKHQGFIIYWILSVHKIYANVFLFASKYERKCRHFWPDDGARLKVVHILYLKRKYSSKKCTLLWKVNTHFHYQKKNCMLEVAIFNR